MEEDHVQVTDKHFREWEQAAFGYGYGTGEAYILPALQTLLCLIPVAGRGGYEAATLEAAVTPTVAWLLINVLFRAQVLDYGTSPRSGWLTATGTRLRDYMLSKSPEDLYAIATQDFDPDAPLCSRDFCNCAGGSDTAGCVHNPLFPEWQGEAVLR